MAGLEEKAPRVISFLAKELFTCGAILSMFELCEALRELGQECYIVSSHGNEELESYFKITPTKEAKGTKITFSPKIQGDYAYIRTRDDRWKTHKEPKIAVSEYIYRWIGADTIIGNGTHRRFKNTHQKRDIDILIAGNYEKNKNINETIQEAKKRTTGKIIWFGRKVKEMAGIETIENPRIEEIPNIYNRAKTFLSMSKDEGWGRPVAEAMKCGCNVINLNGGNQDIEIVSWQHIAKQLLNYLDGRKN